MVKAAQRILVPLSKVLFSVAVIYWMIATGKLNLAKVGGFVLSIEFLPMLLITFAAVFLASERWRILLKSQQIIASSWQSLKLSMIGNFFNFAMPGGVGGDFIKAYYCSKDHPHQKMGSVTSVLMDRVLGLFVMAVMALTVMVLDLRHVVERPTLLKLLYFLIGLVVLFLLGFYILFSRRLKASGIVDRVISKLPLSAKLAHAYHTLHLFSSSLKSLLVASLASLLSQCFAIMALYYAGLHFAGDLDLKLKTFFIVAPLGFMATAIPVSPAGVGIGQAAFFFLFNEYIGQESDIGSVAITALQISQFGLSLSGAVFNLLRTKSHRNH